MTTLKEQYKAIIKEYVRQFCEITNLDFEYWTGPVDGQCGMFGDMSFTAEEIMFVVDNIGELAAKYGSREAVGKEITDWFNYITDDGTPERLKSINLFLWLRGLSDEDTRKKRVEAAENEENREKEKLWYIEAAFGDILTYSRAGSDLLFQDPSEVKECWQKLYDRIQYHAKKINDKYNK